MLKIKKNPSSASHVFLAALTVTSHHAVFQSRDSFVSYCNNPPQNESNGTFYNLLHFNLKRHPHSGTYGSKKARNMVIVSPLLSGTRFERNWHEHGRWLFPPPECNGKIMSSFDNNSSRETQLRTSYLLCTDEGCKIKCFKVFFMWRTSISQAA